MFSRWNPPQIRYDEPVFRPPSEGQSLLIQVTLGCSNNMCTYCSMYRTKSYRVRPLEEIKRDIDTVAEPYSGSWPTGKVFLCDGDALGAPMDVLVPVIEHMRLRFPSIRRFGVYATAQNILEKTDEELQTLSELGLKIAYLGMESGCDKVLKMVVKGNTAAEMEEASLKIKRAGWRLSVIAMLGLGGRKHSASHVAETARVISKVAPNYFSFLTTVAIPGTPYARMVDKGLCEPLTTKELLCEMRDVLAGIQTDENIIFRANHVSNVYPVGGTLCRHTGDILQVLDQWIQDCPEGTYPDHGDGPL